MSSFALVSQGVREAVREAIFFSSDFTEPCEIRYKEGFGTACWMYRPPHVVVIGLGILSSRRLRPSLDDHALRRYAGNFYHHEMAHARYTSREGPLWALALEDAGVPFRLYNLFEDARIEPRYVQDTGRPFKWTDYERSTASDTPLGYFSMLIQGEGKPVKTGLASSSVARIRMFYDAAVATDSSEALRPLLVKWLKEFPEQNCPSLRFEDELALAYADEDAQAAFLADCTNDEGGATPPVLGTGKTGAGVQMSLLGAAGPQANGWPDHRRTQALAATLHRAFMLQQRRALVVRPAKRVSIKHFVRGDSRFYREKRKLPGQPEHVVLILDCSSSMAGTPMSEARVLLSALSQLAQLNLVRCTVLLSANLKSTLCWQRIELPMQDRDIAAIHACGSGEAIQGTLLANRALLEHADRVYVYTDGDLRDEPVDKASLHKLGVYTTGLYVGCSSKQPVLEKYFDRSLVRDSIEEIGLALTQQQ